VNPETPRRTAIVLDRSGSMEGAPIRQARKAIEACLATLTENDSFALIAFNDSVESMSPALLSGTRTNRDKARGFLDHVDARVEPNWPRDSSRPHACSMAVATC